MEKIRLGVSSCLLGNPVRYDGQHKLDPYLRDKLGRYVEWLPVCPEVECGLPVPREAMHLEGTPKSPRLITLHTRIDLTDRMQSYVARRLDELAKEDLYGFVFKNNSPSSGLERVKIYSSGGASTRQGQGLFAGAFAARFPLLAVTEEGMLRDRFLRERFLNKIFTMRRWRETMAGGVTRRKLSEFQTDHKLMLLCHAPGRYNELGRLVETGDGDAYYRLLIELLSLMPTARKHVNVMHHVMGYFKKDLVAWEKEELLDAIGGFAAGRTAAEVPLTLLRHYARKYDKDYLLRQTYWDALDDIYA